MYRLYAIAIVVVLAGCGKIDVIQPLSQQAIDQARAATMIHIDDYCIDGVIYLINSSGYSQSMTVKYDSETLLPQRCSGSGHIKSR